MFCCSSSIISHLVPQPRLKCREWEGGRQMYSLSTLPGEKESTRKTLLRRYLVYPRWTFFCRMLREKKQNSTFTTWHQKWKIVSNFKEIFLEKKMKTAKWKRKSKQWNMMFDIFLLRWLNVSILILIINLSSLCASSSRSLPFPGVWRPLGCLYCCFALWAGGHWGEREVWKTATLSDVIFFFSGPSNTVISPFISLVLFLLFLSTDTDFIPNTRVSRLLISLVFPIWRSDWGEEPFEYLSDPSVYFYSSLYIYPGSTGSQFSDI